MARGHVARGLRIALAAATALTACLASAQSLEEHFRDPPASARPRVWWHWMNGNVTKDGIAKDLAWMKRAGIGGLQNFDANLATPQIVGKRLAYMTPEWKDAFRFAAAEADRLGLELAIASSAGWSETGGPWVTPDDAMKKLVWSETVVEGGKRLAGALPPPPRVAGPYQTLAVHESFGAKDGKPKPPEHYRDVAVFAYPAAATPALPTPQVTTGDGAPVDAAPLLDASLATGVARPSGTSAGPAALVMTFVAPQTVRSLTLFAPGAAAGPVNPGLRPRLEASDDGRAWRPVTDVALSNVPSTASFAAVTAKAFRVVFASAGAPGMPPSFTPPPGLDLGAMMGSMTFAQAAPKPMVTELRLSGEARVNQFEAKAGFALPTDYYALDASADLAATGPAPASVIDLTARLKPDGTLDWTPPKGRWRIVRLGWSLTGKVNHPATDEATGLEVDKLDPAAVRRYLDHYLGLYRDAAGPEMVGARGVRALLTDSTEVGAFNWTGALLIEFRRLRGYDPTPWLPTLTGAVIGSARASDAFLYDFRRTIGELHATAHYGTVAEVAHANGLKVYGESLEGARAALGDDLALRRYADYPMAAMWYVPRSAPFRPEHLADMKGASSVAHLYGQNIAAAESMTSVLVPYATGPAELRRIIDMEFAQGINLPVIHTSPHQPVDDKFPGVSLGIFGQYFTRHETWAEMARPWIDYIARNALMLQQGRNVADVAYFYGEEAPAAVLYSKQPLADGPKTSAYDFVDADALTGLLRNDGGDLVTPGGARYRLLYLGGTVRRMTLATLRKVAALADGGATIVGPAPVDSPSRADDPAAFAALVGRLWAGGAETRVGQGRVIAAPDVEAALRRIGVAPDFRFTGGQADSEILFVHRALADGESYFVNNRKNRAETVEARFRVTGKAPELWHADTGRSEPVSYRIEGGETIVPLALEAEESVHVVFRTPAAAASREVVKPVPVTLATLDGQWTVAFQPGRGAPASVVLPKLAPLNEQADPGVKYFSGVATYTTAFAAPRGWTPGAPLWLDLGDVRDLAEVSVNGVAAGAAWHPPFRIDIGGAVRKGRNTLEVRVANLWVNRLIGDAQPGARKIAWTATPTYQAKAALRPAGLIGPVVLRGEGK